MIKFIYEPNPDLMQLINTTVIDYGDSYLTGVLEEESSLRLKSLQLFLVCEPIEVNNKIMYKNPLAVVAMNDYSAVSVYFKETDQPGSVMCTLESDASKAKVRPVEY